MRPNKRFLVLAVTLALLGCKDKSVSKQSSLHDLVLLDDVAGMGALLARGGDINAKWRGDTPLHYAIRFGNRRAIIEFLIAKGADIHAPDRNGQTPLHVAVKEQKPELVRLLLDKGANPNFMDAEGLTPALVAMDCDLEEVARDLVAAGAEVTIHLATYLGNLDRIRALLEKGVDVDSRDPKRRTPLHWAARTSRTAIAVYLLEHGANPNAKGEWNRSPLVEATIKGHKDLAEALIAGGAEIATGEEGDDPLYTATWYRQVPLVELLLSKGAAVNKRGTFNRTPLAHVLHAALDYPPEFESEPIQYRQMAEMLLAHGAEVNPEAGGNELLLLFAIRFALKDQVEKILAKGNVNVDVPAASESASLPLLEAAHAGHRDIVELLIAQGADVRGDAKYALFSAAHRNDQRLAELLLKHGADANAQNMDGETPLHRAVLAGMTEMVEFLIAHGAGLNIADIKGNTPLHYAARENPEITKLLLAESAPVNTKNNNGDTPLHNAALRGNREIVELLLARGADAVTKDNDGNSAYDEAVRRGYKDIAALLYGQAAKQAAARPANRGTTTRR